MSWRHAARRPGRLFSRRGSRIAVLSNENTAQTVIRPSRGLEDVRGSPTQAIYRSLTTRSSRDLLEPMHEGPIDESLERHVLQSAESSFEKSFRSYRLLRQRQYKLYEREYLAVIYKASRANAHATTRQVFDEFCEDEAADLVLQPRRADRTWATLSFERLQMVRFVLWSMLATACDSAALSTLYRIHVHNQYNREAVYESDPLNFMLRLECMGRFADQTQLEMKERAEQLLAELEKRTFHTSYSSAHAFFRFIMLNRKLYVHRHRPSNGENEQQELSNVLVDLLNRYPMALARNPKRMSLVVSVAANAGCDKVAVSMLKDAEMHNVALDATCFAHALSVAETEEQRQEITSVYSRMKERNAVFVTQNEESSIPNYLLLYAIYDGNMPQVHELLHEMQYHNNQATKKTIEELFRSVSSYREEIRLSEPDRLDKLQAMPSILELFNRFPTVIPKTVHTVSSGIVHSLKAGDIDEAITLLRTTVWSTSIVLRPEVFAQIAFPLLAGTMSSAQNARLLEVERLFDAHHPGKRETLNAQIVNLCESSEDSATLLAFLSRWQELNLPRMSKKVFNRVMNLVSKQLQLLREEDGANAEVHYLVDGMPLSFRGVLLSYADIMPSAPSWTIGATIIRSATNEMHEDARSLLEEAIKLDIQLEPAAYRLGISSCSKLEAWAIIGECADILQKKGLLETVNRKYPEIADIIKTAQRHTPKS